MNQIQALRQHWMSIMAKSPCEDLQSLSDAYFAQMDQDQNQFEYIRPAQIGLTQVRARMGGTGSQFNLGDMTITRCVVRSSTGHYGHSYIVGRNKDHATLAAKLDALLQEDAHQHNIMACIIKPLEHYLAQKKAEKAQDVAQTKVNFFTLVRGED